MPKGIYRRKRRLNYKRKISCNSVNWRAKVAVKRNTLVVPDAIIESAAKAENPPPTKRERLDLRPHNRNRLADCDMSDKDRRLQIYWYWRNTLNCPPPSAWKGHDGCITVIVRELQLPMGSRKTVLKVLTMAWKMRQTGLVYDGRCASVGKPSNRGLSIKPGSLEEQVVADCYEDGFSLKSTAFCVYRLRRELHGPDAESVGVSSVRTCIKRLNPTVTSLFILVFCMCMTLLLCVC